MATRKQSERARNRELEIALRIAEYENKLLWALVHRDIERVRAETAEAQRRAADAERST